ncbi:MAG: DUF4238 domain-containing protein [Proteobacteria bacterium]|nr:DUF4238 domain-containing protein [Pseudomonadota bacterium]
MNAPKLHHYVPQFHLRRFAGQTGRIWVWDKTKDSSFLSSPSGVAAETGFYRMTDLAEEGHDPLTMEKQFSALEGEVSLITGQWLNWLREIDPGEKIHVPKDNREIVSLYIALQFLRTADSRDIISALIEEFGEGKRLSEEERRRLHTTLLWDEKTVKLITDRVRDTLWIFGRNSTSTPFLTSDNPVAFRTFDNAKWLKAGILSSGTYVVFPLAPDIVMYCHPEEPPWEKAANFNDCLSPVPFSPEMVESENSGQVFMATRFVISQTNDFNFAREFARSIGTDLYARKRPVVEPNAPSANTAAPDRNPSKP